MAHVAKRRMWFPGDTVSSLLCKKKIDNGDQTLEISMVVGLEILLLDTSTAMQWLMEEKSMA